MGGSGSGGGSSGKVDYPEYMKKVHADWLNAAASDGSGGNSLETDITTVMNTALGASPFTTATAYDPDYYIAGMAALVGTYQTRYLAAVADMDYADIMDLIKTETADIGGPTEAEILASVAAFSDSLDEEIETTHIPRFQRGMQDINAVQSSSFVLGQAMIEEEGLRKKAQYEADIRLNAALEKSKTQAGLLSPSMQLFSDMLKTRLSYADSLAKLDLEYHRMSIVAYKEQTDKDIEIDEKHANWDLDVFHYGGNLLAAIGGGTSGSSSKPSQAQSAIGGALSGASAGAMIGSAFHGPGTAIGAGIGAIAGGLAGAFS